MANYSQHTKRPTKPALLPFRENHENIGFASDAWDNWEEAFGDKIDELESMDIYAFIKLEDEKRKESAMVVMIPNLEAERHDGDVWQTIARVSANSDADAGWFEYNDNGHLIGFCLWWD